MRIKNNLNISKLGSTSISSISKSVLHLSKAISKKTIKTGKKPSYLKVQIFQSISNKSIKYMEQISSRKEYCNVNFKQLKLDSHLKSPDSRFFAYSCTLYLTLGTNSSSKIDKISWGIVVSD